MRIFLSFCFIAVLTITSFPQQKLDSLVAIGNEQSFQFDFKNAKKTFEKIIKTFPNSSSGYYFLSRNSLWLFMANKDTASEKEFNKYYKLALDKSEIEYEAKENDAKTNFNLGNIYLLKSIYSSIKLNKTDAFWATKKAVSYLEDAIDLDENFYAPYLPLGTIKYALGFVPGFLGWAISIAGLEGEKYKGLNFILKAYNNSTVSKVEAAYQLGKIYTEYSAEYEKAERYLSEIINKYPKNELFMYQYIILQIEKRDLPKAEKYIDLFFEKCNPPIFKQTHAFTFFLYGEVLFRENRFAEAIEYYEKFIKSSNTYDYTGSANYKIALSYLMINENMKARQNLLFARNGNENIYEDALAAKMSLFYFENGFTKTDSIMVLANNFLESEKYESAIALLNKITSELSSRMKIKSYEIKTEAFQKLNKWNMSKEVLARCFSDKYLADSFSAKCFYFSALQYYHEKNLLASEKELEKAFDRITENDDKAEKLFINLKLKLKSINN